MRISDWSSDVCSSDLKSGTNDYHFGGFFEYSDNGLRSNSVAGDPVPPIEAEKRWGMWAGGPIIKDRLFFFGAYEHQEAGQAQDDGPAGAGYANATIGRAHVCTPVTNAHILCRLL